MTNTTNILLIDDHSIIINAYKNSLNQFIDFPLNIDTAACCDSAIKIIEERDKSKAFDVVFLDISLPASKNGLARSGEDIGVLLKAKFPLIKIIVITGYIENIILSRILQNTNPESLLLKADIKAITICEALLSVMNNIPYYSETVLQLMRKKLSSNIILTKIDKQLLYELFKGTKTKDLHEKIPLSISGIEKRKRQLRELFNTTSKDDSALVASAVKKGFL